MTRQQRIISQERALEILQGLYKGDYEKLRMRKRKGEQLDDVAAKTKQSIACLKQLSSFRHDDTEESDHSHGDDNDNGVADTEESDHSDGDDNDTGEAHTSDDEQGIKGRKDDLDTSRDDDDDGSHDDIINQSESDDESLKMRPMQQLHERGIIEMEGSSEESFDGESDACRRITDSDSDKVSEPFKVIPSLSLNECPDDEENNDEISKHYDSGYDADEIDHCLDDDDDPPSPPQIKRVTQPSGSIDIDADFDSSGISDDDFTNTASDEKHRDYAPVHNPFAVSDDPLHDGDADSTNDRYETQEESVCSTRYSYDSTGFEKPSDSQKSSDDESSMVEQEMQPEAQTRRETSEDGNKNDTEFLDGNVDQRGHHQQPQHDEPVDDDFCVREVQQDQPGITNGRQKDGNSRELHTQTKDNLLGLEVQFRNFNHRLLKCLPKEGEDREDSCDDDEDAHPFDTPYPTVTKIKGEEINSTFFGGKRIQVGHCYEVARLNMDSTSNLGFHIVGIARILRTPSGVDLPYCIPVVHESKTYLFPLQCPDHHYFRGADEPRLFDVAELGDRSKDVPTLPEFVYDPHNYANIGFYQAHPTKNVKCSLERRRNLSVLDIFAGAGGMHLGFKAAGFKHFVCIEKNASAYKTLSHNGGTSRIFLEDVREFLTECENDPDFYNDVGVIHHIHASPPCQGFSYANRLGGQNDEQNNRLTEEFVRAVTVFRPLTATYENVDGLAHSKTHRLFLKHMIRNLLRKGYQVRVCRLNAMDYGDPQNRARIIVFAAQNGIPMPNVPAPTHGDGSLQPRLTIREAIGGLVDAREYDPNVHGRIPNMEFRETSIDLERDNDEDAVLEADSQANVIRASPGKIPIHYKRERLISVREAALIQSFPLRYKFHGDIHSQYKQVGNAVPVGLATAIARSVHDALQRIWEPRDAA